MTRDHRASTSFQSAIPASFSADWKPERRPRAGIRGEAANGKVSRLQLEHRRPHARVHPGALPDKRACRRAICGDGGLGSNHVFMASTSPVLWSMIAERRHRSACRSCPP
mgnify:CR=1 FL=1